MQEGMALIATLLAALIIAAMILSFFFYKNIINSISGLKEFFINEQRRGVSDIQNRLTHILSSQEVKFDMLRNSMDLKLSAIQSDNEKRLDQMREVVSEKLESSIEKRLSETFKIISGRIESVHRAMGEMHDLASGVGDLKRILSNANARGIWGEVQLENILQNILTPRQYAKNCKIKPESREVVEFAIKLPGKNVNETVLIPVDAKFPMEAYNRLCKAREINEPEEKLTKDLISVIKKNAKDIADKYIHPPHSTDFGIMFLPAEGLYAEVLRCPGLIETLQEEFRVIVTGPTTFSAIVSSLNMGFRTLAIESKSSEIWKCMEKISKDFSIFSSLLVKTRVKLEQAGEAISLAEKRSISMQKAMNEISSDSHSGSYKQIEGE